MAAATKNQMYAGHLRLLDAVERLVALDAGDDPHRDDQTGDGERDQQPVQRVDTGEAHDAVEDSGDGQPEQALAQRGRLLLGGHRRRDDVGARAEVAAAEQELGQTQAHAERGEREAEVPVDALTDGADDQRGREGAQVDPDVEDREATVTARVVRAVVEVADHRGDVGLQQAGTDRDQTEAGEEGARRRQRQREVTQHDDRAGDGDGLAGAEDTVGEPAAREGEQVHEREVDRVDRGRGGRTHVQTARSHQVQREQSPHAVVGETLPHLGHEESGQSAGVAEEGLLVARNAGRVLRQAGRHGRSLLARDATAS